VITGCSNAPVGAMHADVSISRRGSRLSFLRTYSRQRFIVRCPDYTRARRPACHGRTASRNHCGIRWPEKATVQVGWAAESPLLSVEPGSANIPVFCAEENSTSFGKAIPGAKGKV